MFEVIENHENRNQNHDLKFHMIISSVVEIMHSHVLFHYEILYTDVFTTVHHAEMTVEIND